MSGGFSIELFVNLSARLVYLSMAGISWPCAGIFSKRTVTWVGNVNTASSDNSALKKTLNLETHEKGFQAARISICGLPPV